jgi:hypothetical protein
MSVHTWHPDVHEAGLADACPRCTEHALNPWAGLDQRVLADLRWRVAEGLPARSQNEHVAMQRLRDARR